MKRFSLFTLALYVAVIGSASATGKSAVMQHQIITDVGGRRAHTQAREISSSADLEGEYKWSNTSFLDDYFPEVVEISDVNASTGECTILFDEVYEVTGVYNETAGTLSIANGQHVFDDVDGPVYFYLKDVGSDGQLLDGKSDAPATVGTIEDNNIVFPEMDVWVMGDYNNEEVGYYFVTYHNLFEKKDSGDDPNDGWTSYGEATLMDGWLLPRFEIDQTDEANWYKVEMQQNVANPNVYRLVDPYKGNFPCAEYNNSTKSGYIQFDVTDPDHVTFELMNAGFVNAELGISKFYCYNVLSGLAVRYGSSYQDIIDKFGDTIPYTTYKDGVVHLTAVMGEYGYENDTCFGVENDKGVLYVWGGNMETKIFFPGVLGGITPTTSDDDASAEYYNLQGIRIQSPAKGQIVVEKKGTKVTKTVYNVSK